MTRGFCFLVFMLDRLAVSSIRAGVIGIVLAGLASMSSARAKDAAVGVNVINPYVLSLADQNAMLDAIHASGVSVIRASITLDDKGVDYAERAWNAASGSSG